MKKNLLLKSALALALATPLLASAESQLVVGTGNAAAKLNFRVVIPRVLFLGVGTGATTTPVGNNATVDTVTFDYTGAAADVGSGTPSAAQPVNVRVLGNNGQITLAATTSGALANTLTPADTIPWTEISATTTVAALPSPVIPATGTGATSNVTVSAGKVTNRSAVWNFVYANSTIAAPGTYGAIGGQVTYTASML